MAKLIRPDTSTADMNIMDSFVNGIFVRIASKSSCLAHNSKRSTITKKEIKGASRLLLPIEFAKLPQLPLTGLKLERSFVFDPVWLESEFFVREFSCQQKAQVNFTSVTEETATPYSVFWKEYFTDDLLDFIGRPINQDPV